MKYLLFYLLMVLLFLTHPVAAVSGDSSAARAMERAEAYAQAIDHEYKNPEKIYAFLDETFRKQMSEDEFCEAFAKERSYPYITPLYIRKPQVRMDGRTAHVVYDQAARLIGMTYEIELIFENGDWYVRDWDEFLDGSYLKKFGNIPYSLDWYYDTDALVEGD